MDNNKADLPTGTSFTPMPDCSMAQVSEEFKDRCAWAKAQMSDLWDHFISMLEARTFSLDELTRGGKRLRNLYGSVEDHKKVFLEAAAHWFEQVS